MAGTRSKFNPLIQSLPTVFPDNESGQITPSVLRDFLDSFLRTCFIPDAFIAQGAAPVVIPLTTVWSVVPIALWTGGSSGTDASGDITASLVTGRLTGNPTLAGLDYATLGEVSMDGPVNSQIDIGFFLSGVAPAAASAQITLTGAGKAVSATLASLYSTLPAAPYFELSLRAPSGAVNITMDFARFNLQLKNTWGP